MSRKSYFDTFWIPAMSLNQSWSSTVWGSKKQKICFLTIKQSIYELSQNFWVFSDPLESKDFPHMKFSDVSLMAASVEAKIYL